MLSAFIILNIKYGVENVKRNVGGYKEYFDNLKDGFKYFKKHKLIFNICIFGAVFGGLMVPLNSLQAAYVSEGLMKGPELISSMNIAIVVGMILWSLVYPRLAKKIKEIYIFVVTGIGFGLGYIGMSLASNASEVTISPLVTGIFFLAGIMASIFLMVINVAFMSNVDKDYIGRVGGLFNSLAMCATPVASIAPFTTIVKLYMGCGVFVVILFVVQIFNKTMKEI